ncbi:hypothetical protein RSOLAG1IB_10720 [Rhizoctonia solani AG-1 IB]|uniref:Uncharacterized protein n=1 Tax=Thanatephorus cucumeris (strain AG1-IB / isolate 7/3/14) TaxID=1108050 RepID=A0A0B7G2P6_THACB|nr:hypothetical protein RSOLAG1IB_10720 [Rhizoctonia solani AG-1 IB]
MIPAILDNICLGNLRVERLSSLAHAAECLATAATTLSDAARAAAETFALEPVPDTQSDKAKTPAVEDSAPDVSVLPPLSLILLNPIPGAPPEEVDIDHEREDVRSVTESEILRATHWAAEPDEGWEVSGRWVEYLETGEDIEKYGYEEKQGDIERILSTEDSIMRQTIQSKGLGEDGTEPTLEIEETFNTGVEVAQDYIAASGSPVYGDFAPLDETPIEISHAHSSSDAPNTVKVERTIDPKQPYRILVNDEFEVLLTVCALIGKDQRVICYMPCGTPPLSFYKPLIENVTGASAYFPERMSAGRRDAAYKRTLEAGNAVALVSSTLLPDIVIEGDDSWVIHIGWPSSYDKYISQFKKHKAKNNVIVACSGDIGLYPSHTSLMTRTQSWPKYGDSLIASTNGLRQEFENALAKISDEIKEKDWIQTHGVYGPRYVKSWDSTVLVERANRYLVHALQYRHKYLISGILEARFLPEVSWGFVTQNSLEQAALAGVLQVKHQDSGLNHISSLAHSDVRSSSTRTSTPTAVPSVPASSAQKTTSEKVKAQGKNSRNETPAQAGFKLTNGHTYFPIEEEFDAIPLICFIAGKYDKVVCFLEGQGSLRHYQKLFGKILQSKSQIIAPEVTSSDQANNDAALRFVNSSSSAILLLTYSTTNLPPALRENRVGYCVYWGFHLPLKQAKKHRDQLSCSSTAMIITQSQQNELKRQAADITEHPSARTLLDLGPQSLLWPMRNTTVSVLMTEEATVKNLYVNRIYGLGAVSRAERSAEEVLRMANQFSARVLLRGDLSDGSDYFPPIAGRLSLPRTVVDRFHLQPAVTVGLATIG